jgi:hypothetical protein
VSLTKQRKGIVIFASFMIAVGVLALIWLACWGVSFWLIRQGITYVDNPLITSLTFLSFSVPLVVLHWRRLEPLAGQVTAAALVALLFAAVLTILVYAAVPNRFRRPVGLIARHPEEFYLRMDYRYLVPKTFEVLFQQLVIVVLTLLLAATGLSLTGVVLGFLCIFGLLHLPMLRIVRKAVGLSYGIASVTLAAVFPILILRVDSGFIYSYTAHWFFYTIAALVAWVFGSRG